MAPSQLCSFSEVIKLMVNIEDSNNNKLEQILKETLQQCVGLARKKIRSKRGISDLQNILTDYHENTELASIILQVLRLIVSYQSSKQEEEEVKETVSLEDYAALEAVLQKCQASNRQQIRNQQQLKVYCQELQSKKEELEGNNKELLNSTKQIITKLKREHQRLIEQNATLRTRAKDSDSRVDNDRQREQAIISSLKKARKIVQSHNSISHQQASKIGNRTDRSDSNVKLRKGSLSAIKVIK